jgi:hypothetical protein
MARKKLVLMASEKMDTNKKEGRNENGLIRMSAAARENLGFANGKVELWPADVSGEDRMNKAITLTVFHAFKDDVAALKEKRMSEEKRSRVGFVTTKMFRRLCGDTRRKTLDNIWISNDIYDTVIGTDPEFLIVDADFNVKNAQNLLGKMGDFGGDGAMAEVRPKPEVSVDQLVENMRDIFKAFKDDNRIGKYRWVATCWHHDGSRGYPVGGHIHVGNPSQLMEKSSTIRSKFYKVLNKIMDEYLAIPMVKLDGKDGLQRRKPGAAPMGPFGHYGGPRTDLGRLEHRTLSGIWMIHPELSKVVLGTAKAVIDETFKIAKENDFKSGFILPGKFNRTNLWSPDFDSWEDVPLAAEMGAITTSADMCKVLKASDDKYWTKARNDELYDRLKGMSTYKENSRYVDGFCEILKVKFDEFNKYEREIQKTWLTDKKFFISV